MADEMAQIATEITSLQREVGLLTAVMTQAVATLDTQGALLRALLEAVTATAEDDGGLADALARIAGALEGQTEQLTAIRQSLATLPQAGDRQPR